MPSSQVSDRQDCVRSDLVCGVTPSDISFHRKFSGLPPNSFRGEYLNWLIVTLLPRGWRSSWQPLSVEDPLCHIYLKGFRKNISKNGTTATSSTAWCLGTSWRTPGRSRSRPPRRGSEQGWKYLICFCESCVSKDVYALHIYTLLSFL